MKTLTPLRSAAVATFAVAALSLPTMAQASDYKNCGSKSQEEQLVAGLIGAVIGGVAGSQIAGNGARTEGSAIGAIAGGIAGAAIADGNNDCDKKVQRRGNNTYSGNTYGTRTVYQPARTPAVYDRRVTTRRVYQPRRTNGYRSNRNTNYGYNNGYRQAHNGYDRSYNLRAQLEDVRYRLHDLRDENRRLERRIRRDHHNERLIHRQEKLYSEIRRLKRKERRLKRRLYANNRNYY